MTALDEPRIPDTSDGSQRVTQTLEFLNRVVQHRRVTGQRSTALTSCAGEPEATHAHYRQPKLQCGTGV